LIKLAAAIASQREGEIIVLKIITVPEQMHPSQADINVDRERPIIERAHAEAQKLEIPVSSLVRVGHLVGRAILETADQYKCDLVLMGWKGYTSSARKILGEITDSVVTYARTDIMLVKLGSEESMRKILVPTAGGMHAREAEKYIADMARSFNASLKVCSVIPPRASVNATRKAKAHLEEALMRIAESNDGVVAHSKLVKHKSISVGIIRESQDYDTIVMGAARESRYTQILFGTIPENVAKHTDSTVILVKHYKPVDSLLGRIMD